MVLLEQYLKEPIYFLRTVTLKNKYFADQMLATDVNEAYQNILDQADTPYYKHLNGEYILKDGYTSINEIPVSNKMIYTKFDTMMYIMSLDTQKEIAFTKANLKKHPKTASWYRMPNSYFFKLCDRYPTQTDLIKSIIYPVEDIDAAIQAENFTILNYDKSLLQDNEYVSIINAIQSTLDVIRSRWDVKEYVYEDMYAVVQQSLIWYVLYYTIIAQRVKNIRTASVHEWHIWEYLKSKGIADYRDVLSFKQALFLYKNIDYLLKHKGTNRNFSILIGALMSELNVSLYTKSLIQSTSTPVTTDETVKTLAHQILNEITSMVSPEETISGTTATPAITSTTVDADDEFAETSVLNPVFGNVSKPAVKVLSTVTGDEYLIKQAASFVRSTSKEANSTSGNITTDILSISNKSTSKNNITEALTGTIEQLSYTFKKEQESSLEYTDEDLYELSTNKQEKQFPVTPHTLLVTKAHEINKNVKSVLFEQIYAKFMTDSYLYRAALGDLNGMVITIPLTDTITVSVTVKAAIALAMYFAAKEYGITLTFPPSAVDLYWGYKSEFPELPKTFKYQNKTKLVSSYLTDYGFTDMRAYPSDPGFVNVTDLAQCMDDQAMNFIHNYMEVHEDASSIHFEILAKVYEQRTIHGRYYINLLDGEGMTYDEYFDEHEDIKYLIESYENATDKKALYSEVYTSVVKELFPVDNKYLVSDSINDSYVFNKIKQLFISLCSYNVTFFDKAIDATNPTTTFWLHTQELLKQSNKMFIRWWFQVQDEYWKFITKYYFSVADPFAIESRGPDKVKYGIVVDVPNMIEDKLVSIHPEVFRYINGMEHYSKLDPIYVDNIGSLTHSMSVNELMLVIMNLFNDINKKGILIHNKYVRQYLLEKNYIVRIEEDDNLYVINDNKETVLQNLYDNVRESVNKSYEKVQPRVVLGNDRFTVEINGVEYDAPTVINKTSIDSGINMIATGSATPVYRNNVLDHIETDTSVENANVPKFEIVNNEFVRNVATVVQGTTYKHPYHTIIHNVY